MNHRLKNEWLQEVLVLRLLCIFNLQKIRNDVSWQSRCCDNDISNKDVQKLMLKDRSAEHFPFSTMHFLFLIKL